MMPFDITINGWPVPGPIVALYVLATLVNLGMAVFWTVVGWRMMHAHERLPEVLRALRRGPAGSEPGR